MWPVRTTPSVNSAHSFLGASHPKETLDNLKLQRQQLESDLQSVGHNSLVGILLKLQLRDNRLKAYRKHLGRKAYTPHHGSWFELKVSDLDDYLSTNNIPDRYVISNFRSNIRTFSQIQTVPDTFHCRITGIVPFDLKYENQYSIDGPARFDAAQRHYTVDVYSPDVILTKYHKHSTTDVYRASFSMRNQTFPADLISQKGSRLSGTMPVN